MIVTPAGRESVPSYPVVVCRVWLKLDQTKVQGVCVTLLREHQLMEREIIGIIMKGEES